MKYFINLLLLFLISSCQQQPKTNRFLKKISDFDKVIINHFPLRLTDYCKCSVYNDTQNDVTSILLLNKYDKEAYNKLKDSLIKFSKEKYSPKDSCLLVVNMYSNEKNYFNSYKTKDKSYLNKECLKNKLPIPNFWAMDFNSDNITKLPIDFDIYVIEAKDEIINKKYLSKNVYMPDFWKHGYSKGVATNDKTNEIIYWFVLW